MKFAKLVEDVSFPSNVGIVGAIILVAYFWNSPYFLNNAITFIASMLVYKATARMISKRVKSETKKFTYAFYAAISVFLILSYFLPLTNQFFLSAVCLIIFNFIIHFVRDYWKVSAHTMAYTAMATVLSLVDVRFAISFVLLPIVIWSRLVLKRHDMEQIIAAFVIGLVVPMIVFTL
ncbi:hypothetical protein EPN87_02670 [archaeon]|nr:MAG: hypothetical protein EPN87_02670 [archaeon]